MMPVVEYLTEEGCTITSLWPAKDLVRQIRTVVPRLVVAAAPTLLDLLDVCRTVRSCTSVPLVVVGHEDVETDEVLSLEYGADAYLPPNSSPRRLRAHLQAVLRRARIDERDGTARPLQFGILRIDTVRRRVYRGDREVDLSQKEYSLLAFLVEHAGRTVSRQELAGYVWGSGVAGEGRSLDVHIHWLREKLEVDAANPEHIRTVRGIGYCFEP
jgi:DNA-binding response OmpR family regulator